MIFDIILILILSMLIFKVGEYRGISKAERNKLNLDSKHKSIAIYYLQKLIRDISDSIEDHIGFPETIEDNNKRYDIECLKSTMEFLSEV